MKPARSGRSSDQRAVQHGDRIRGQLLGACQTPHDGQGVLRRGGRRNDVRVVSHVRHTRRLLAACAVGCYGAVAVAAAYAGDAIIATTRAAYPADWAEFAG